MKRVAAACLALLLSGCLGVYDTYEQSVVQKMNEARVGYGLPALTHNACLHSYAEQHANLAASRGYISHSGNLKAIGQACGTNPTSEILARVPAGQWYPAVWAWLASPDHRPYLLASYHRQVGVGVVTRGDWSYITALLG